MTRAEMTGVDYLIGAAEQLKSQMPLAQQFQDMAIRAATPGLDPKLPYSSPTEMAAKRELQDFEQAAVLVFAEAVRVALARGDTEAVRELVGWGVSMVIRFDGYMKQRRLADEMLLELEEDEDDEEDDDEEEELP